MSSRDVARWAQSTLAGGKGFSLAPGLAPETFSPTGQTDDGTRVVVWSWVIGAAALTVTGIVIAAAFAAGARRQLTTLGQLNANGASAQVLRRVLFLQGTWTGLAGAAAGLSIGAAVLAGLASHRYQILGRDVGSYRIRPSDVVPPVVLGILAATVAALLPARTASRTPVVTALAGRRPLPRAPPAGSLRPARRSWAPGSAC
jgi:putative ABC transport system permease protein